MLLNFLEDLLCVDTNILTPIDVKVNGLKIFFYMATKHFCNSYSSPSVQLSPVPFPT